MLPSKRNYRMDSGANIAELIRQLQLTDDPDEREAIIKEIKAKKNKHPDFVYIMGFSDASGEFEYTALNDRTIELMSAVTDGQYDAANYLSDKITSDAYDVEVRAVRRKEKKEKKEKEEKKPKKVGAKAAAPVVGRRVPTQRVSAIMNTLRDS